MDWFRENGLSSDEDAEQWVDIDIGLIYSSEDEAYTELDNRNRVKRNY